MKNSILIFPVAFGIALVLIFFQVVLQVNPVRAESLVSGTTRFVETNGSDSSNDCSDSSNPCKTIQHAIDAAGAGDEIRVAEGTYSEITTQPVPLRYQLSTTNTSIDQVVFISKTITLKGGYSAEDWAEYDPLNNPTIIDPQGLGRGIVAGEVITPVVGTFHPVVQGFQVTGGEAAGLEGGPANWDSGGGIYAGYFSESTILLEDMQVFSNTAEVGGGVYFDSVDSTVRNSSFRFNNASELGGGLYFWGGTTTSIEDSTIESNVSYGAGGGVVIEFMFDSRIINSSISSNWAASDGGGIHATSAELEITNNLISGNASGDDGGGVYLLCCEFTVANNQILTNLAIDFGGGLAIDEQTAIVLENNQITGNYALKGGGAAFGDVDDAMVVNNIISNNKSSKGGGLHFLAHESRNMVFINNAVIDNEAGKGSGIYLEGVSADFYHTTIARNWAEAGDSEGVYVKSSLAEELNSHVYFTNTIIFSHTIGVFTESDNTVDLNGVLWSANGSDTSGDGDIAVANAFTGSPDFSADGYHLEETSAGIDHGVPSIVNFDIDGQIRPIGPCPDLGVDEFVLLDLDLFLPIVIRD